MSYAYNADIYCDACAREIMEELDDDHIADSGDTNDYPQPILGSDEADSPQHCGHCHEFLENDLTTDGRDYVIEALRDHIMGGGGTKEVLQQWQEYYSITAEELLGW
jgi:hypothetical protein